MINISNREIDLSSVNNYKDTVYELQKLSKGEGIYLSEVLSSELPILLKGSIIVLDNQVYLATKDEDILGKDLLIDGTVHIKTVVSIDGKELALSFTNDALPIWDQDKNGWYEGSNKYINIRMNKNLEEYTSKGVYLTELGSTFLTYDKEIADIIEVNGDITFYSDLTIVGNVSIDGTTEMESISTQSDLILKGNVILDTLSVSTVEVTKISFVLLHYYDGTASTEISENDIFELLSPYIPNVGDSLLCYMGLDVLVKRKTSTSISRFHDSVMSSTNPEQDDAEDIYTQGVTDTVPVTIII